LYYCEAILDVDNKRIYHPHSLLVAPPKYSALGSIASTMYGGVEVFKLISNLELEVFYVKHKIIFTE